MLALTLTALPQPTAAYAGLFDWETRAPVGLVRAEGQGILLNGKLYLLGGFYNTSFAATTRSDVYDPVTNSWERIADMPEPITHAPVVADGTTIYVLGGYLGDHPGPSTAHVWKYDTLTNVWSAGPSLPAPRGASGAAIIGRKIHFFGGALRVNRTTNDVDQTDHWVLDLNTGVWSSAAPLPVGRNHMGGIALNGKVYAIGGQFGHDEATTAQTRVDVYDPATNTWARAADLPKGRSHIGASVFEVNGRIAVIGGSVNGGTSGFSSNDVYLYDPGLDMWHALELLPEGRKSPIAGFDGTRLVVATGNAGAPTSTTWVATLPDRWERLANMPTSLGEVAGGIIGRRLYLVGQGNSATLAYDLSTNTWTSTGALAVRPFVGHHHAAEVVGGRLYLFGGLGNGQGKVQIYNPATNQWSTGRDMPFAAGSSSSAVIGGKVYVAGGIVGSSTTSRVAVYDPAADTWEEVAPMPQGRNHAAGATDGTKLYIFGGRGPGSGDNNSVANGFDTVQIYDPATNSWVSSLTPGSTLAPLPQARGGQGRAVFAGGRFYVIGGETISGAGATADGVYHRVDVYDPASNTWSRAADMPTARHGIFPLLSGARIYIAGGGVKAAYSISNILEVYNLPLGASPPPPPPPPTLTPTTATPTPTPAACTVERFSGDGGGTWGNYRRAPFPAGTTMTLLARSVAGANVMIWNVQTQITYLQQVGASYTLPASQDYSFGFHSSSSLNTTANWVDVRVCPPSAATPTASPTTPTATPTTPTATPTTPTATPTTPTATPTTPTTTPTPVGGDGGYYVESGGSVVIEAERFTRQVAGTGSAASHSWVATTSIASSVGSAMISQPETNLNTGLNTNGPALLFDVEFTTAGTYYIYVRGYGTGPAGDSDSVHVGLNGQPATATSWGLTGFMSDRYTWRSRINNIPVQVQVPAPGRHTVHLWVREDGTIVDRIWLSTSATAISNGSTLPGPAESQRLLPSSAAPALLAAAGPFPSAGSSAVGLFLCDPTELAGPRRANLGAIAPPVAPPVAQAPAAAALP